MKAVLQYWRVITVLTLLALPVAFLCTVGFYHLWQAGWWFPASLGITASLAAGYFLAWRWQTGKKLLTHEVKVEAHWTERDRKAFELVQHAAEQAAQQPAQRFTDPQFYFDTAKNLAETIAVAYHPHAKDPYSSLTIPELMTAIELASSDLNDAVQKYLPGGHVLTIRDMMRAPDLVKWYNKGMTAYWVIAALFNPVQTAARFAASRYGVSAPLQKLQENLLLYFVTLYIQRLGGYLIEMHSGRLKVGARRYRELKAVHTVPKEAPATPVAGEVDAEPANSITIALVGQVKAGKSSLVNAILGEQKAVVDALPATSEVTRYRLQPKDMPQTLTVLDTQGYGHAGPGADQLAVTEKAAREADILLLVLHARNPARQADLDTMRRLREWFDKHPELRMPPVLAVLTHVDLLTPAMEWQPPYDWKTPTRPKEQNIRDALTAARDQLGEQIVGAVPVCTTAGKVWGVEEELMPALTRFLDEAHAVALLRCLRQEANLGKVRRVFGQMLAAGQQGMRVLWEIAKK